MNAHTRHWVLIALGAGLSLWGILNFFLSAYFAAPAFGMVPPAWSTWVASIPLWALNLIDTAAAAAIIIAVVLAAAPDRTRRVRGSRATQPVLGIIGWLIVLAILAVFSYVVLHFTLPDFLNALRGFVFGH